MAGELSRRAVGLRPHYGVIVVGSGYGGAVVAARLATAGADVCVLERGKEWKPGDFPESPSALASASSFVTPIATVGKHDALFRFQVDTNYSALTGSGVGGTSLINAGVMLRPSNDRLAQLMPWLPSLDTGYARAEQTLKPTMVPSNRRLSVISRRATEFASVPIAVSFDACTGCGNCVTGCNVGAKSSLDRNYLPLAVNAGAEIYAGLEVLRVWERNGKFGVELSPRALERERFEGTPLFITADVVVLSAGALGSTQILWQSREQGLPVSSQLGQRFSGNGTVLSFTDSIDDRLHAMGESSQRTTGDVGPTITGMLDLRGHERPMLIQDSAIPKSLVPLIRAAFGTRGRNLVAWSVTAGDDASGSLRLQNGRLRMHWPRAGRDEQHRNLGTSLREFSARLGGRHRDTILSLLPWKPLITTHPLGGCAMGTHGSSAVVDSRHRVFRGDGATVHDGLYVCDGAVFPGALGTNPLWTISALAERCAEQILEAHPQITKKQSLSPIESSKGVRFTERMEGWLSPTAAACPSPKPRASGAMPLSFLLTVEWPSVEALKENAGTMAASVGTLRCPLLSSTPLTVTRGAFQLFVETPEGTRMKHELRLRSREGAEFMLEGHKEIVDDPGPDLWHDTRTLFIRVWRVEGDERVHVGHGVVQTGIGDLMNQVQTIKGTGITGDLKARADFLVTFLGRVRKEYGGLVLPLVR